MCVKWDFATSRYTAHPQAAITSLRSVPFRSGSCSRCKWKLSVRVKWVYTRLYMCMYMVCTTTTGRETWKRVGQQWNAFSLRNCQLNSAAANEIKLTTKWAEAREKFCVYCTVFIENWVKKLKVSAGRHHCRMCIACCYVPRCPPSQVGNTF